MEITGKYKVNNWMVDIKLQGDSVNGVYYKNETDNQKGSLNCTLDGDLYKGTYTDPNGTEGVMHLSFHETGFDGKWGKGLDTTSPRGTWTGTKIDGGSSKATEGIVAEDNASNAQSVLSAIIGKENAERITMLYDVDREFCFKPGFDFAWLNELADKLENDLIIGGSNDRAGDIIEFIFGRYDHAEHKYTGTPFSDILENVSIDTSILNNIKAVESDFLKKAEILKNSEGLMKRDNQANHLFYQYIDAINVILSNGGLILQRSENPRGGEDFNLIIYYASERSDIINFLLGYGYAKNAFDGWWEDALNLFLDTDRSEWFNRSVSVENIDSSNDNILPGFRYNGNLSDDEYPSSNFEDLNLFKENLLACVDGYFAAWHHSKTEKDEF